MIPEHLKANQLVEITIYNQAEEPNVYKSRVEEVTSDKIYIGIPIVNGALLPVYQGDRIQVSYQVKKEYNQVVTYSFNSVIRGRAKNPIPVMVLELPDTVQKAQRRNYLRIPVELSCCWNITGDDNRYDGRIVDLSGGGCLLRTTQELSEGMEIQIELKLPDKPALLLNARVVRVTPRTDKTGTIYHSGIEFNQIRENYRDIIVRYLFDLQRENIKKRRI